MNRNILLVALLAMCMMTPAFADTYLTECGGTDFVDTFYLQNNVSVTGWEGDYCYELGGASILDCQGYTISGFFENPYVYQFGSGSVVRNCNFESSDSLIAIFSELNGNKNITNNTFVGFLLDTAIYHDGGDGILIAGNTIVSCDAGIGLFSSDDSVVTDNTISDAKVAIIVSYSNGTVLANNTVDGFQLQAIQLNTFDGLTVNGNIISGDGTALYFSTDADGFPSNVVVSYNIFNSTEHVSYQCGGVYTCGTNYFNDSTYGNFWGKPDGTGFSDTCVNTGDSIFCDESYQLVGDPYNVTDYHPLTYANPAEAESNPFVDLFAPLGDGLGNLLASIALPLGTMLLYMGIIFGVMSIVYVVAFTLRGFLK